MNVDVLIIATLADEFRPVRERLHAALAASNSLTSSGHPSEMIVYEGGRHNRYEVFFMSSGLSVAIASLPGMGQLRSAAGTGRILADIRPRVVLLTGIAA
jgi:nucleoside phosphorylase